MVYLKFHKMFDIFLVIENLYKCKLLKFMGDKFVCNFLIAD